MYSPTTEAHRCCAQHASYAPSPHTLHQPVFGPCVCQKCWASCIVSCGTQHTCMMMQTGHLGLSILVRCLPVSASSCVIMVVMFHDSLLAVITADVTAADAPHLTHPPLQTTAHNHLPTHSVDSHSAAQAAKAASPVGTLALERIRHVTANKQKHQYIYI